MDGDIAMGGARDRLLTVAVPKMTVARVGLSLDHPMASGCRPATVDSDSSRDERTDGATFMDLYTADLMVQERMDDRERDFEANRLADLARPPRGTSTSWRERVERTAAWFRIPRRRTAT